MKNLTAKIILLVLYLMILIVVQQSSHLSGGFIGLLVLGVLSYSGIIIAAHVAFHCYRLFQRLIQQGKAKFSAASVALVVETEVR